jgi:DNA polymerase
LRGTLQFSGASRTGRWAGRTFQPQNLPRPNMKQPDIEAFIRAVKVGVEDITFDDVMTAASNAIRGIVVAPPEHKLVVSDLSNIEGRVLAWLAEEAWKLEAFREFDQGRGHDLYALAYARSFGVTPEAVMDDKKAGGIMRQIGKVQELALGYQGAVGAFASMAAIYGVDLPESQVRAIVNAWRAANPNIVSLWAELDTAVRIAIGRPGHSVPCRRLIVRRDGAWLRIILPSKRSLCYAAPQIVDDKITYMGMCPYTKKWKRLKTYGGKLVENVTQATACEVLKENMQDIDAAGYAIVLTVHDETLTVAPDLGGENGWSAEDLSRRLAHLPAWADGLPLAAGGFEGYRYKKD